MMRRTLSGPLRAQDLGGGVWRLSGVPAAQLYLRLPPGANHEALLGDIQRVDVEWHEDTVTVRVSGGDGVRPVETATAILHEARDRLYEVLPLADFDARARRFWRRVFLLIRIPGGGHLLRLIARRGG